MRRIVVIVGVALALWMPGLAAAQARPADPKAAVAPGDEIKLEESNALKAAAIQSRMQAILANLALLQRQFQDLQQEWNKSLDERKKLLEDAARRVRVDLREANDWVYDESGQRYVRSRKAP